MAPSSKQYIQKHSQIQRLLQINIAQLSPAFRPAQLTGLQALEWRIQWIFMLFFKRIEHPTSLFKDRVIEVGSVDHPGIGQARSRRRFGASCCAGHYATLPSLFMFSGSEKSRKMTCLQDVSPTLRSDFAFAFKTPARIFSFLSQRAGQSVANLGSQETRRWSHLSIFPINRHIPFKDCNLNTKLISSIFMRISKSYFSTMWEKRP